MRATLILPLACAALALSACKKEPEGPKSPDQVKQEVAALARDAKPQPGKYRTTIKFLNVAMPGMPQAQADRMAGMFSASGKSSEYCLTPEMADKGFEQFGKRAAQGNCSYDSFSAGDGRMDAVLTCTTGATMTTRSELHGTFSPTGSNLRMKTTSSGGGMPGGGMTIEAEVINERIGDC